MAEAGGCRPTEVSVGQCRQSRRGLSAVLAQCPLAATIKVDARRWMLHLGWMRAGVELLAARPLFCYNCLEQGHVRSLCRSSIDRSFCCYRCGNPSHRAAECTDEARCLVCEAAGRPSGHKLGGSACKPPTKSFKRRKRRKAAAKKKNLEGAKKEVPCPTFIKGDASQKAPPTTESPKGSRGSGEARERGTPFPALPPPRANVG